MAFATSFTSAPVFSHNSLIAFIEETRCAKKAFAVNFDNSEDHTFVVKIRSLFTQFAYTSTNLRMAS